MKKTCQTTLSLLILCAAVGITFCENLSAEHLPSSLLSMSLEELMQIEVTSASKKPQKLSDTAAAVYVISKEDIRRSGATCIPEALRMVPGLQVARVDAHRWAITSRGQDSEFANELLVLMDGRTIYTPVFGGVYWSEKDYPLEEIERIEVIRGPGAALWGANAVNGIINIITKNSHDSQGALVVAGMGSELKDTGTLRYGDKLGDSGTFRIYGKYFERDNSKPVTSEEAFDHYNLGQGGFRLDFESSPSDQFTLQGDLYDGREAALIENAVIGLPYMDLARKTSKMNGANAIGRWTHTFSEKSDLSLQLFYDRTSRSESYEGHDVDTGDFDFQHRFEMLPRNEIIWGLGYRTYQVTAATDKTASIETDALMSSIVSSFVQDEISLIPERLRLILGTKLEHNDYTGFEVQPTARMIWTPNELHSLWASFSRATRTPSVVEDRVYYPVQGFPSPLGIPGLALLQGDRDLDAEELFAYELGYRMQVTKEIQFDVATFYNHYSNFISSTKGTPYVDTTDSQPILIQPINFVDGKGLDSYGVEFVADFHPLDFLRVQAWYAYINIDPEEREQVISPPQGSSPHNQAVLRSLIDLPNNWELDSMLRYVDNLPTGSIKAYIDMDLRLAWRANDNLEFALIGQNLLHDSHREFTPTVSGFPMAVERAFLGKVTVRF